MKRLILSLIAGASGIGLMLAGLAVDAWLHAGDPTLAQREGIFTLSNPGHALLGAGVLLASGGLLAALHVAWGLARPRGLLGRPFVRTLSMRLSALASVGAMVFALAVSAGGDAHEHADAAVDSQPGIEHAHEEDAALTPAAPSPWPDAAGATGASATPAAQHAGHPAGPPAASSSSGTTAGDANASHPHVAVAADADELACGNGLVQRTREATARFADFEVAAAEGYRSNPAKPDATHYANPAYQRDGNVLDLAHPEALVYFTNRTTGEKALLGALFKMPPGQTGPQPCGAATQWHQHAACADRASGDVIPVDEGETCPPGYRYHESVEMMHVWFVPGRKNGVAPVP